MRVTEREARKPSRGGEAPPRAERERHASQFRRSVAWSTDAPSVAGERLSAATPQVMAKFGFRVEWEVLADIPGAMKGLTPLAGESFLPTSKFARAVERRNQAATMEAPVGKTLAGFSTPAAAARTGPVPATQVAMKFGRGYCAAPGLARLATEARQFSSAVRAAGGANTAGWSEPKAVSTGASTSCSRFFLANSCST